ncbi:MAG: VIT1/CCC1 transporter family protein [Acidobacteria bacterium]|nr:VIT1/CCC1 transporter family protein [Acidobacteriota bacterium]
MDAAWLYRALARSESDATRRSIFERLATVEDAHVQRWRALFAAHGGSVPAHAPSLRTRALAWTARWFGSSAVLPIIVRQESREVGSYLRLARRARHGSTHETAMAIATESAEHAQDLSDSMGREGEPWHITLGAGYLRSVVYGFNDGLTANFGLVAGVIGADVGPNLVIVTGVAGALADALSMGSSGYLAAKSQAEVAARQVAIEQEELRLMPDLEEKELALILEAKGLAPARARESAKAMMRDPQRALATKVQEELGIQPPAVTPLADGVVTGSATAVGAGIPLLPFLLADASTAIWVSLTISMLAHFGIGAARSIFTGRSVWASGRDMFLVGFGVAAAGYLIGGLLMA